MTIENPNNYQVITGSNGNDVLSGADDLSENKVLDAGAGDDTLITYNENDIMAGGSGNDTYDLTNIHYPSEGMPIIVENAGEGVDTMLIGDSPTFFKSYTLADNVENISYVGTGEAQLFGNEQDNEIRAGNGFGYFGGYGGNDTIYGGSSSDIIDGGDGNNVLNGGGGNDTFYAYAGQDTKQNDTIYSKGEGQSVLSIYGIQNISEIKVLKVNNDIVVKTLNDVTFATIKDFYVAGGTNLTDIVIDNYPTPPLTFKITDLVVPDVLVEVKTGTAATDKLTATDNISAEYYGLAGNDTLTGAKNDDYLDGGDGTDTLIGNGGTNTLVGGLGNDTYIVSSVTDKLVENVGGGTDTVKASVDFTLASQVENLTMTANGLTGTGNELANTLTAAAGGSNLFGLVGADKLVGGAGNDYLDGGNDNDTITAGGGDNTLIGGLGNDNLTGGVGINTLIGGEGVDTLTGGTGTNNMFGGNGNDTYTVVSQNDTVTEELNEGTDTVKSKVNFSLGANLENLTMLLGGLTGTGNELANTLTAHASGSNLFGLDGTDKLVGGAGNDYLDGGNGADTLTGGAGINTLIGGEGNDILTGGTGTNNMFGGTGNDTYTVISSNDTVTENLNEGTDLVKAGVNFTLGDNLENLTMTLAGLTGNGNNTINTLTAHAGGSNLFGYAGNDKLVGGAGNDYLDGGDGADTITGGNGNNTLLGGAGNDTITGGTGIDDIRGGLGNDILTGGVGSDIYHFGLGDGQDTINNSTIDTTVGRLDKLVFDSGVNADQLWFQKSGNNLVISVLNTTDKITVSNWYTSANNHIQEIVSGDGLKLNEAQVDQLVQLTGVQTQPIDGHITGPALDVWGF